MKNLFVLLFSLAMFTMHGQIKWQSVEKVYANIITAIGDGTKIAPPIESSRTQSRVAYYSPSRQTVFVEEKFLEVCATFGPDSLNALAFILGHELAHFYRNHGWVSSNGLGYVGTATQEDWKNMRSDDHNRAKDESEADIFSGFYALIAGYDAMPVAEKTLKKLYAEYGIPDTIPGYPTLGQRVEIATNAMAKSRELYIQFNVGLYCLANEKFEVAARIYTSIYNQDYAGGEILNNLAVAQILQGYQVYGLSENYYYPVFINSETPLGSGTRGEGETLIIKGIGFLKEALKKDDKNFSVFINLASAYAMLNEFVDAEYYLAKAEAQSQENTAIFCLKGIIAAKKGDEKSAKSTWKKYRNDDALINNNYIAHFENKTADVDPILGNKTAESNALKLIDQVDISDPALKSKFTFSVIKLPGLKISYIELEHSTLVEVYGGGSIDYRFQSFENSDFESTDFAWKNVLKSTTTDIDNSGNYNVLKLSNRSHQTVSYVKYVWY